MLEVIMKKVEKEVAEDLIGMFDKPFQKRQKVHDNQIGPDTTYGWKLKRRGAYFIGDVPANDMYGRYLGSMDNKWYVGVLNLYSENDYNSTEIFDSLEEVQQHWVVN
jgi:hypothetical protein